MAKPKDVVKQIRKATRRAEKNDRLLQPEQKTEKTWRFKADNSVLLWTVTDKPHLMTSKTPILMGDTGIEPVTR